MKRICIISLFILLASCAPVSTATPTPQPGQLSLNIPPACITMEDGLCLVPEPGEYLTGGKTVIINQAPVVAFLPNTSTLQVKVGDWTFIFDPGNNVPMSQGMTFPNAKLYPNGNYPGMSVEVDGKKCDQVDGEFLNSYVQAAQNVNNQQVQQINPVTAFDINFSLHCNQEHQVVNGRVKLSQQ